MDEIEEKYDTKKRIAALEAAFDAVNRAWEEDREVTITEMEALASAVKQATDRMSMPCHMCN